PKMMVLLGVYQLHVDNNMIGLATDAAFQNIGDPKRFSDFAKILRTFLSAVSHHAGAANDAKVLDSRECSQNVVLNSVRKESVLRLIAHVFKRQNGNTLLLRAPLVDHKRDQSSYQNNRSQNKVAFRKQSPL